MGLCIYWDDSDLKAHVEIPVASSGHQGRVALSLEHHGVDTKSL